MKTSFIVKQFASKFTRTQAAGPRQRTGLQAIQRAAFETLEGRRLLSFSPAVSYPVVTNPQAVATADFDGDGRLDLAVANNDAVASSVSVLLGNAGGTFQPALTSPTGGNPRSLAVGDFNADGKADVVTANVNDVSVLLGTGSGTFQAPISINLGTQPASVAVGDFNADGKLDLGVASNVYYPASGGGGGYYGGYYGGGWYYPASWSGRDNVLLGNGDGSFAAPTVTGTVYGYQSLSAAVADFNGDGKLDFATSGVGYYGEGIVTIAPGTGTGTLGAASSFTAGASPRSVAAGDVNGDGKVDLVTANSGGNTVSVLLGNGLSGMVAAQDHAAGASPVSVAIADFNGDAKADLLTANAGDGTVGVLLSTGTGTFRMQTSVAAGSGPTGVAVGDFNGDGRADAASSNQSSNDVSVLLNDGSWPDVNAPSITINDVTVTEENTGTLNANFTISLSAAYGQTVTVRYTTADGTATTAAGDYAAASAVLTFAPGETSKTVTVAVNGDRIAEDTETFSVRLSEATNAFVTDSSGTGTILDNEPRITIDDASAAEGNSGTKTFTFTLHLSAASDVPVSVNYSTVEGDTDYWPYNPYSYYYGPPAATAGSDFAAKTGTATFAAGQTSTTVTVIVNGDRAAESDEAFSLDLTNAIGALIDDDHAVGTILNDEPYAHVSSGGNVTEGNSGTQLLPFTITLSNATDVPVTVNYATADGTATAGGDYVAKSGSVTFAAGETSKTVNVTVNGDRVAEGDEYLYLNLTSATNAGLGTSQSYGYIIDDEPRISINNGSITEGNRGSRLLTFTVTLSAASDQPVTVNYATQNGSAKSGKDYTAKSGTITFAAGQTTQTVTVSIKGDRQREADETFYVLLSNPSANARIGDGFGEGTILNDDFR